MRLNRLCKLFIGLTLSCFLQNGKAQIKEIDLNYKELTPIIDGETSDWESEQSNAIEIELSTATWMIPVEYEGDLSASFKASWDDDYLYLLVEVMDDTVHNSNTEQVFHNDNIELYLDLNNNDVFNVGWEPDNVENGKFVFVPGLPVSPKFADTTNIAYVVKTTESGYLLEAGIKWTDVWADFSPGNDTIIGLEINIGDNDDGDKREHALSWSGDLNANKDATGYGDVTLVGKMLPIKELNLSYTESSPIIDGETSDWENEQPNDIEIELNTASWMTPVEYEGDLDASFKASWDDDYLYLLVEVLDDTVNNSNAEQVFHNDNIELYLDLNNNDVFNVGWEPDNVENGKFVFVPGLSVSPKFADTTNIAYVVKTTENGYLLEAGIKWTDVWADFSPSNDTVIGLEINIGDNDNGEKREHALSWSGEVNANKDASRYGDVTFVGKMLPIKELNLSYTESSPVIDGEASDWENEQPNDIEIELNTASWMTPVEYEGDLDASFKASWDDDYLYLLVEVLDDTVNNSNAEQVFHNDNIELYLDLNNNGVFNVGWEPDNVENGKFVFVPGLPVSPKFADTTNIVYVVKTTENGYVLEAGIKWTDVWADFSPGNDTIIGLEINIGDNDNGEKREHALSWSGEVNANKDASRYGDVVLLGKPAPSSANDILSFEVGDIIAAISEDTISLNIPEGTELTSLIPTITISEKASVEPASEVAQDFSSQVTYTVTAENGNTKEYVVKVNVITGIEQYNYSFGKLYPNPITDYIKCVSEGVVDRIEIFNISGLAMMSVKISDNEEIIDISDIPSGIYFVKMYNKNKVLGVQKIIKH